MSDEAPRYRHRSEPWREQLIAEIALLREPAERDRSVLAHASRLAALAQAQEVVSGASDIASAREGLMRLRDRALSTAPTSQELSVAAAARARALDAVVGRIDAMPVRPASDGPDPAPRSAA
ncbi:MAG TPA: hypothetical protein VFC31_13835 [Candidatus Limnocylindria bacterium]|nr:hypothetical protein [Candidatus Limnocylindria bacterium]